VEGLKALDLKSPNREVPYVLDGRPVELSADLAVPVGMALHELTANAARFVALSVPRIFSE
jgi:two-component sensor histidine kinase